MAWISHSSGVWQIKEEDSGHFLCGEKEAALCLASSSQVALFLVYTFSCYDGKLLWTASTLCWALVIWPSGSLLGAAAVM